MSSQPSSNENSTRISSIRWFFGVPAHNFVSIHSSAIQLNARARWNDAPEPEERTDSREDPQIFIPQFPQWMPDILPGTLKRHEEQRIFCCKNNTATSIKRDSSGAMVVHPRLPTFTLKSPCDDSFFVNMQLVGASKLEKLAHAASIVAGIYRKEMILMPGGKLHPYVGRFHGTRLDKVVRHCASTSSHKVGNMRLYRSHLVECGAIEDAEDHGVFHLRHLNPPTWSWCKISRMQIRRISLRCVTNQMRAVWGRSVHICSQYTTWHLLIRFAFIRWRSWDWCFLTAYHKSQK